MQSDLEFVVLKPEDIFVVIVCQGISISLYKYAFSEKNEAEYLNYERLLTWPLEKLPLSAVALIMGVREEMLKPKIIIGPEDESEDPRLMNSSRWKLYNYPQHTCRLDREDLIKMTQLMPDIHFKPVAKPMAASIKRVIPGRPGYAGG
jgi:hypothetical protein